MEPSFPVSPEKRRYRCRKPFGKRSTVTSGLFGDPAGYEERLYQTPEGFYFLYGLGGDASPYPKETIKPASAATAEKWQAEHAQ